MDISGYLWAVAKAVMARLRSPTRDERMDQDQGKNQD